MIVTLEEVKDYMRVDGDEEDALITSFVISAEDRVEAYLRYPLTKFGADVPDVVKQAIFYIVGKFYEEREVVDIDVRVLRWLLDGYRKEEG